MNGNTPKDVSTHEEEFIHNDIGVVLLTVKEQTLYFKSFGNALSSRGANRKSQKLCPFAKLVVGERDGELYPFIIMPILFSLMCLNIGTLKNH